MQRININLNYPYIYLRMRKHPHCADYPIYKTYQQYIEDKNEFRGFGNSDADSTQEELYEVYFQELNELLHSLENKDKHFQDKQVILFKLNEGNNEYIRRQVDWLDENVEIPFKITYLGNEFYVKAYSNISLFYSIYLNTNILDAYLQSSNEDTLDFLNTEEIFTEDLS